MAETILILAKMLEELRAIDASSAILRLFSVRLFVFNNKNTWIIANINILTNLYNLFQMGFYLKVSTKIIQIIIQAYAWFFWNEQDQQDKQSISKISASDMQSTLIGVVLMVFSLSILQTIMQNHNNIVDTYIEVAMICLNYTGLWLSVNRKIECWMIWGLYNFISAYAYFSHQLPCNAIGSIIMIILAIQGYFHWLYLADKDSKNIAAIP